LNANKQKKLLQDFANTVCLVVDERSMMSADLLGMMEHCAKMTAHKGTNTHKEWGGIPIVILVGDDHQLPSIDPGAFYVNAKVSECDNTDNQVGHKQSSNSSLSLTKATPGWTTMGKAKRSFVKSGLEQFQKFSKDTVNLGRAQRVHTSQVVLFRILEGIRGKNMEACLTQEDAELLCTYHLRGHCFTDEDKKFIKDNSLWLFANKAARNDHNSQKIKQLHSKANPVAKIKALTTSNGSKVKKNDRHFDADRSPPCVSMCRNARIEIAGMNCEPGWGLCHGSIGTVQDIVFSDTCSPNNGDLPDYVLVEFPQCCGPAFFEQNQKLTPIVPVEVRCEMGCCKRRHVPLKPAFGKTCHTFQGQNAGPMLENQPANTVLRTVCDPGNRGLKEQIHDFSTRCCLGDHFS
jgi:hypothetical protein